MKKNKYNLKLKALIFLSFLFCFLACEKEQSEIDYRDKYVGDYKFDIIYNYPIYTWVDSLQMSILIWHDTTYSYSGFIKKSTNSENRLLVHWGNDTLSIINNVVYTQTNEMIVDSSGILSYPEYFGGGHTYFYPPAYIRNDSTMFNFGSGGLGMWSTWNVTGLKK